MTMSKRLKIILGVIAVIIVSLVVLKIINNNPSANQQRSNTIIVKTQKPFVQNLTEQLEYNGNIAAIQQANIFSKVSGNLENIFVDIGNFVNQGQLLAVVDSTQLYQTYQQAYATYYNNKIIYERNAELFTQNLIAKQDLDNSEAAMKIAEASYKNSATQLSYSKITAPFSGYITQKYLDRGALIQNNNSIIFTLMKMDVVKVYVYVLEKDLPLISENNKCTVTVDASPDKQFFGKITRKSNSLDLNTRTMTYEIDIPNQNYILKPGMFATVYFLLSEHNNAITIPKDALLKDASDNFVFVVENGKAKRINVVTGLIQDNLVEITGGLNGSEDIITTGQEFAKDNVPVHIQSKEDF
jgi:membrane fusion protein, multidrug efflux system